jgi:hypothetical protein
MLVLNKYVARFQPVHLMGGEWSGSRPDRFTPRQE